ncbi:MAG: hypothetical protein ACOC9B_04960 [Chloroflexota bacterium]
MTKKAVAVWVVGAVVGSMALARFISETLSVFGTAGYAAGLAWTMVLCHFIGLDIGNLLYDKYHREPGTKWTHFRSE